MRARADQAILIVDDSPEGGAARAEASRTGQSYFSVR